MASGKEFDSDAPATHGEDWVGAAVVRSREGPDPVIADPLTFHVFRASNDGTLFAVTDSRDPSNLPGLPDRGEWIFFKWFVETGQERIGLSESRAKADIDKLGYHLCRVRAASEVSAEVGS